MNEIPGLQGVLYANLASSIARASKKLHRTHSTRICFAALVFKALREHEKHWVDTIKRIADLLCTIPVGIIAALTIPFVAIAIKFSSPEPLCIRWARLGKMSKPFTLIKFRTMHTLYADGGAETAGAQFTTDTKTDPRLFPVGRLLRQLRIDELPQIWNVLRGYLSFIGPRSERPEFVKPLEEKMPFYALRHLIRTGLTGWAQVRYLTPVSKLDDNLVKLQYDLYYIRHRSPLLDMAILLRTIGIVLRRQGT